LKLKVVKRFAHNATSTKVELPVRYPSKLDMRPYVEGVNDHSLPPSIFMYDLFAVVTHEGKLDNGHYWADVLSGDEWWHCDDDKGQLDCIHPKETLMLENAGTMELTRMFLAAVTPTPLASVLAQKAYMLFYVKRSLAFAGPPSRIPPVTNGISNGPTHPVAVAGKTPGGKSAHPIRGMAV